MSRSDSSESTIEATRKVLSQIKEATSVTMELPASLTRKGLNALEPEWPSASKASAKLIIDVIDEDGMAAVQLLVSEVNASGPSITFDPPPLDEFTEHATKPGIAKVLGID
ncbi:MAG: hypothetical protein ACI8Z1_002077 [Candidatus Azotimanducaceae bacterium]|jgi:hypothetical protein